MTPITGSIVAIVTPMHDDGSVDYASLRKLIDWHVEQGTDCIGVVGTTGESPTVNVQEHCEIIRVAVEQARGRVPVMAGCGANSTREAIELTQFAHEVGADCHLQVVPYYNKPAQQGLYQHFKAIADNTKLPLMLYSIPGRCGIEIGLDVLVRLAESCPNIRSIKEAGGNPERVSQMKQVLPADFEIMSGDDGLTLPFMSVGGVGIVSVASNLIPKPISEMVQLALKGDYAAALQIHTKYYPLFAAFLKLATNPIPIKTAMALAGHCSDELRLPLVGMEKEKVAELTATLKKLGIIA